MTLSTHPLVLSIDTEGPIIANDFESQWITQTKQVGNRPLRDIGINGKDQIISVVDSGLDINHKYFGPTSDKVFDVSIHISFFVLLPIASYHQANFHFQLYKNDSVQQQWDYTQRKVVRYDHSLGDKIEPKGGHGTKVAGAALGKSRDNEDDVANGIADGAKLHIFDIQQGKGKIIV